MKTLHVSFEFPPHAGGVETLVAELASWQAANGHEVTVVTGTTAREPTEHWHNGVQVHRLPFVDVLTRRDLDGIADVRRRLLALLAQHAPQILHLHPVSAEMMFMRDLARTAGIPVLTTLHVDIAWLPQVYRTNLATVLKQSNAIAAVSRSLLGDATKAFSDEVGKLHLVENGVAPRPRSDRLGEPDHFLFLGRLSHEKGVDVALNAAALLERRGTPIHLTIAGDGPIRPELQTLAEALDLSPWVTFLGHVDRAEIPDLLARHAALVVPSRWREPFGLVVIEAALAARPAIVSDAGALPELVEHGVTGLLVEPENVKALAAAMLRLLQAPDQAMKMGIAAESAASTWSIARCGAAYQDIYGALIGTATPSASPR